MNEPPNNPFAGPSTESAPERHTSRKTLLFAGLAIIVLEHLARELGRDAMIHAFIRDRDSAQLGRFFTYASIAGVIGSVAGVVSALRLGPRRTLIIGSIVVAAGTIPLAVLPWSELAVISALGPGLITTPLYVMAGRTVLDDPELRDAWFTSTTAAVTAGSFLGALGNYVNTSLGESIVFAVSGALATAIIPIAVLLFQEPAQPRAAEERRGELPLGVLAAALVVVGLSRIPDQFLALVRDPANSLLVTAQAAFTFLGSLAAAIFYLTRHASGREDQARQKIALGAAAAALAAAVIAASDIAQSPSAWAATILDRTATILCVPIGLGLAATIRREKIAYLSIAVWTVAINIISMALTARGTASWLPWTSAAICAAIAALLYFRTGWGRRSS